MENTVSLSLATLHRQIVRSTDSSGSVFCGVREVFEPN
jgi:hypothetical protein